MSCSIVVVPVVIASWPAIAGAVVAAAAAMGYEQVRDAARQPAGANRVALALDRVEEVAAAMGRGESITVRKGAVSVTFAVDARKRLSVHVDGPLAKAELERIGQEIGGLVVQQYVHRRLREELAAQGFIAIEEERQADRSIRLRVRRHV